MDILVFPSYREGFGAVNIEAGSMALPVITTDIIGPNEAIVDGVTGLLVPPRSTEAVFLAMKRLLDDPDLAARLGKAGRQRVIDNYECKQLWQAIVQHRLYLLEKSRRRRCNTGTS